MKNKPRQPMYGIDGLEPEMFGMSRHQGPRAASKDEVFPFIHYSDPYWDEPRTIFGETRKGLFYNYSDRFMPWDSKKDAEASKAANESGAKSNTVRWWEAYLTCFHGYKVVIEHVTGGTNRSTGYSYLCFGYNSK